MKKKLPNHLLILIFLGGFLNPIMSFALGSIDNPFASKFILNDTIPASSSDHLGTKAYNPFELEIPIEESWEYDATSGSYQNVQKIGDDYFGAPTNMTFEEYLDQSAAKQERAYFGKLSGIRTEGGSDNVGRIPDPIAGDKFPNDLLARLFGVDEEGETKISIKPRGNLDLKLGGSYQELDNPTLTLRQRRQFQPLFDMGINVNIAGQIGEKLKLNTNYNTKATFNFDNNVNIDYDGLSFGGDEIIKDIQAGDISMPLRSNLIQGAQSLFGIRADLQFGKLKLTTVLSQQRSERKALEIRGGKQIQQFSVKADQYDENRHFFLTHYNRDNYEESLEDLPQLNSLFRVQNIEVWITNDRNETEGGIREIVALTDLGEPRQITNISPDFQANPGGDINDIKGQPLPQNTANPLYAAIRDTLSPVRRLDRSTTVLQSELGLRQGLDFDKVRARKLKPTEYTVNNDLGFVSLNVNVQPDQVVGFALEYTYNGRTFRIGEFSQDIPDVNNQGDPTVLFVKMLKSSITKVDIPLWDLMMKNVYSLGAYQVNQEDFELDVYYEEPGFGIKRFLPEEEVQNLPVIRLFNLDDLNSRGDRIPDGKFDFVSGTTILPSNGRLIFPVLEPFGSNLVKALVERGVSQEKAEFYQYQQLYDSTVTLAREFNEFNRFTINGQYLSSVSSEISLNAFNLPKNSIRVTAGRLLVEGVDYEVDYNLGRVKILNDALINAGVPISISFEDESIFGFNAQNMLGLRADYELSEDIQLGGTFMNLREQPFSNKVNIGDDPINNRVYGVDVNMNKNAPFLTKLVDAIPGISTKAPSNINFTGEAAYLQPGFSRAIGANGGTVFLDDFEGSTTPLSLKAGFNIWSLAATPQNDDANNNPLFPEATEFNSLRNSANRAKLAWYQLEIDGNRVGCESDDPYCVGVPLQEIFTQALPGDGNIANNVLNTLNFYFDPEQPGPYNYEIPNGYPGLTAGMDGNGNLRDPRSRWAGVTRGLASNNDFERANYEFIEFWLLDPFDPDAPAGTPTGGDIYFNLGNVSEDVLRDSRQAYEAGLPNAQNQSRPLDSTALGVVPISPPVNNGLGTDNIEEMDLGLDGLNNDDERVFFAEYLEQIEAGIQNANVRNSIINDPSKDDYVHFTNSSGLTVPERYIDFNNPQGNNGELAFSRIPDSEEQNGDNSLNELESYYQYKISLENGQLENNPYVVDKIDTTFNNNNDRRTWYRFKVPLSEYDKAVGGISDFRSIRFVRMFFTNWDRPVNLRFATLDLVRSNWRRYIRNLRQNSVAPQTDFDDNTLFDVSDVNIEENSNKFPFPYVLPPGVIRERQIANFNNSFQNEQSIATTVCNLKDGDARGIYRNLNFDLRLYDSLTMIVHGEQSNNQPLEEGDLSVFIRFGSDFQNNYYEYEYPLIPSDPALAGANADPEVIWPSGNTMRVSLKDLVNLKVDRDNAGLSPVELFEKIQEGRSFRVKGNPNLGIVNGIMIGVRNPQDDGVPHCGEVWFNELAATGINNKGGGAALARLDMQLADFGQLTLSGNYSSIGWGNINQSLQERAREEVLEYDITANINLDKFLPEETGIKIPVFAQYSNSTTTPEFDPYDLDIRLKDKLDRSDPAKQDSLRSQAQKVSTIQSIAFTNIRKERTNLERKPMPWDIENFSFSYAYTKSNFSDPIIAFDEKEQHRAQVNYAFSTQPKFFKPLGKVIKKQKTFDLFKDFNFNLYPTNITVNSQVNRQEGRVHYRFTGDPTRENTYFDNRFTWDRNYGLSWPFTESLRLDFNATARAVVDEIPLNLDQDATRRRDFLNGNVRDFGRLKDYNHSFNLNYELPFKKVPILAWIRGSAQIGTTYNWSAGVYDTDAVFQSSNFNESLGYNPLGNVIQNNQNIQGNLDFNFAQLYRKSPYLSKVYNYRPKQKQAKKKGGPSKNRPGRRNVDDEDKKKKKSNGPNDLTARVLRPLLFLKSAKVSYSESFSTVLPGFAPQSDLLGMSSGFDAPGWDFILGLQPGDAFRQRAIDNDWIVDTLLLNQEFIQTESQKINVRVALEPIRSLNIDLNVERSVDRTNSELFKSLKGTFVYNPDGSVARNPDGSFQFFEDNQVGTIIPSQRERGRFSMTYFTARTLFRNDEQIVDMFNNDFKGNRDIISQRLGAIDPTVSAPHPQDSEFGDYIERYGRYQNEVLIPAFLSAYSGTSPNSQPLSLQSLLSSIPKPNWRVSYSGLSNVPALKKVFTSVRLNHRYTSTLSINDFSNDLNFLDDTTGLRSVNEVTQNYFAEYEIPAIQIQEAFSPLIGLDVKTRNGLDLGIDMSRKRNLNMNFNDYQLAETRSTDYSIRVGYRVKNVYIPFLKEMFDPKGKKKVRKKVRSKRKGKSTDPKDKKPKHPNSSDININIDFSYGDQVTINHQLDENGGVEPTRGSEVWKFSPTVDYDITKQLNVQMFFDYEQNIPKTTNAFPITRMSGGLNLRFSLN